MLKFKQTAAATNNLKSKSPPPTNSNPPSAINPAFSKIKCEPCKASIVIHNITIPLAWPASEYFDHKGEWREFNVCLSLKAAGGKLMRSKIHQRVNRTITDLQFDESFVFSDLDPDFTIEALVSAKRINTPRNGSTPSPFQSVANTISRSFGRRFGANYKKYSQAQSSYTISAYNFPSREEIFSSPVEDLLPVGRCFFRLENAGLSGKIRVYSLALVSAETINPLLPTSDLLPLFGTMCSQVLCIPNCLEITFIRSILDIFYVDEQLLLEKLECALEGGCIKCFTKDNKKEAALVIPIDQRTKIQTTAYQTAFRITLLDDETQYTRDFIFILSNENQITDWSFALQQQITNASAWKEFSSISTNPFALKYGRNSGEFKRPFDDSQSIKSRTMTNTDEIKEGFKMSGLREVSKRGDRRRVQSVFKDIPATNERAETKEYSNLKSVEEKSYNKPSKSAELNNYNNHQKQQSMDYNKSRSTSILKSSESTSNKTSEIQRPKIVETKPTPKPRLIQDSTPPQLIHSRPRLADPMPKITKPHIIEPPPPPSTTTTSSKQLVLINKGYVSSPTKTSPRIPRKEPGTQRVITHVNYVDSVKSVLKEDSGDHQPKSVTRKNVKLEFKEDTIEHNQLPPKPHRVSKPANENDHRTHKTTPIPVEHQKSSNNNNSSKAPPNTYVIRLNVGMDNDDDDNNHDRKPPPPYPSNKSQHFYPSTKPFTKTTKPKPFNDPQPPLSPPSTQPSTIRQKIVPPSSAYSSSSTSHHPSSSSSKSPKYFNTNYDIEITRL
uniref:Anillin homology domain-containing protein n=1 Tax=Panagrolaimus sp. PS1159 TaxID=55785 RepID=A0AC35FUK3_9BILA